MNKELTTEDILWLAIRDIEEGKVSLIQEDPIEGWLKGRNKELNKTNISYQSAKYNKRNNYKPISRPTIDKYKNIINYLQKNDKKDSIIELKKEIKKLKKEKEELISIIKELNNGIEKTSLENYILLEKLKLIKI